MLSLREDIFTDYTEKTFRNILERKCKIIKSTIVSKTGRTLFWYEATK